MKKLSAGIVAVRVTSSDYIEVLLVHPGGPFYRNKDLGVWSVPKGEYDENEDPLEVAKREFWEETGNNITANELIALDPVKLKSGKVIKAWAARQDFETPYLQSNTFEIEWPPRSGRKQIFPEADTAAWFELEDAKQKIHPGQLPLLLQLETIRAALANL
ncbi:NUDIX domain-containing protein [Pedobacter sp. SYSU D00535]|uniref:NUDIX domain-containing protein n=1 Tax=Pedobacter sp. SYSU D00535 TaxID=2810308 RepID=UPI001A97CB2A|nr:NUDIX domain-containing protein [Pedobacter sp. SYSU D00535]